MEKYLEISEILTDITSNHNVNKMKQYIQHGKITTYEHCEHVTILSYKINKYFHLNSDLRVLLTGAMLHDFFLYDWHDKDDGLHRLHGFSHAATAALNAKKNFNADEKIRHVIYCHMWPLNITSIPKTKEAWIVCTADKFVSLYETLFRR